jgi:pimeloyl-ACP methyl ester carboxylesterase
MSCTFVLVPGLFHGGWCWRRVADPLRAPGHHVFTPTLTGLGERAHLLNKQIGLDTFVADLLGVLEAEELVDVVLVGHSFGAVPVLGAADRARDRLKALVLLDGLLPTPGHSVFDGLAPDVVADRVRAAEQFSGGLALPPVPAAMFGVTEPDDVAWMERRLTPQPMRTYRDPVRLANPLGNGLACTYLACINPPYPVVRNSHEQARSREDWTYHELPTGHDAMIMAPSLVIEALLGAAA